MDSIGSFTTILSILVSLLIFVLVKLLKVEKNTRISKDVYFNLAALYQHLMTRNKINSFMKEETVKFLAKAYCKDIQSGYDDYYEYDKEKILQ